jgi:hypothetical protein
MLLERGWHSMHRSASGNDENPFHRIRSTARRALAVGTGAEPFERDTDDIERGRIDFPRSLDASAP